MDLNTLSFNISGSASGAISSLEKLGKQIQEISTVFESATKHITEFNDALGRTSGTKGTVKDIARSVKELNQAFTATSDSVAGVNVQIDETNRKVKKIAPNIKGFDLSFKGVRKRIDGVTGSFFKFGAVLFTTGKLMKVTNRALQDSFDFIASLNLYMTSLGQNAEKGLGYIQEMSGAFHVDEGSLLRVQGLFYQISEALGLGAEKSLILSKNFTNLSYDLATFFNIKHADAVTKLQAGLVGETEPLRRIGIIITENNLAETARNMGIRKSIRNMTEMEKIQLRYVTALQQTQNAHGNLARTMQQPRTQLLLLTDQFNKMARQIFNMYVPALSAVFHEGMGIVLALNKILEAIVKLRGFDPFPKGSFESFNRVVGEESDKTEKATSKTAQNFANMYNSLKKMKSLMTGIDELNILGDGVGQGISYNPLLTSAIDDRYKKIDIDFPDYDNKLSSVTNLFDEISNKWYERFQRIGKIFTDAFVLTNETWDTLMKSLGFDRIENPEETIFSALKLSLEVISGILSGVAMAFTDVVKLAKDLWSGFIQPVLSWVAPNWLNSLTDGSLVEKIANITSFLTKLAIAKSVLDFLTGLGILSASTGLSALQGLLVSLGALKAIDIVFNTVGLSTQANSIGKTIRDSLATGLGVTWLTKSPVAGALAFTIVFSISNIKRHIPDLPDLASTFPTVNASSITPPTIWNSDGSLNPLDFSLQNERPLSELIEQWENNKGILTAIPKFAKGGKPQKGSLFIAGEEGAELVGNFGDGLSVVNQEQMKRLGIPMFANGFNVPSMTSDGGGKRSVGWGDLGKDLANLSKHISPVVDATLHWTDGLYKSTDKVKKLTKTVDGAVSTVADGAIEIAEQFGVGTFLDILGGTKGAEDMFKRWGDLFEQSAFYKVLIQPLRGLKPFVEMFGMFKQNTSLQKVMSPANKQAGGATGQQMDMMKDVLGNLSPVLGSFIGIADDVIDGTIGRFLDGLPFMMEVGMEMLLKLLDGVIKALPAVMQKIPIIIQKIADVLTDKESMNTLIQGLIEVAFIIVQNLPTIMVAIFNAIPDIIVSLIDAILSNLGMFVKLGLVLGLAIIDGIVNIIISGINMLIKLINKIPFVNIPLIPAINLASMVQFADGGYPTTGQMFIAREAGAELVGNIGGRTGVMNNEQIVEAVSRGVYGAVSQALAEQNRRETVVNLDGRRVNSGLNRSKQRSGASFGMGGF